MPEKRPARPLSLVSLLLPLLPLLFLLLFYFYPLSSILTLSLAPQGRFDPAALTRLVSSSYYVRTLWFTTWQAALSTLLTVLLGLPGAYIFARYTFPAKSLLRALLTVPFVLPTVVVAVAFTALLGPHGPLNALLMGLLRLDSPPLDLQGTLAAILLAHVFYNAVLVVRMVGTQWANMDPALVEAARVMGAGRWRAFFQVTLPLLTPSIGAAALMTFIFCFTSFGVVLILGGGHFATLEVEIYYRTVYQPNLGLAAALALVQILLTLGLMSAYTRLQARLTVPQELRPRRVTQHSPRSGREWALLALGLLPLLLLLLSPPLALVARSLRGGGVANYAALWANPRGSLFYVPPIAAVRNSLLFATATTALSLLLGLPVALTIADVIGKGLPAAMLMAISSGLWLPMGTPIGDRTRLR